MGLHSRWALQSHAYFADVQNFVKVEHLSLAGCKERRIGWSVRFLPNATATV